jgi:hypothetical protein
MGFYDYSAEYVPPMPVFRFFWDPAAVNPYLALWKLL